MIVAGVDVGGTNIEVGIVDDDHTVIDRAKTATPTKGPASVVSAIAHLVASLDAEPVAIGVGIPGVVHQGAVPTLPNLVGWNEPVDLRSMITAKAGRPVVLGNDANVGLLGEWLAGAAFGHDDVLGVWMGTGIGGGLILGGRPFEGSRGAAGEIGHVIARPGGALCFCGRRGCVEAYAGRRSMTATAQAMVSAGRSTSLFAIRDEEGKQTLTSKVWHRALAEDDELATQLLDLAVETLAIGVASVINVLDVELVVLGGGLGDRLGRDLADRLAASAAPWMLHPNPRLAWVPTALGDDAGVVGAASLARAAVIAGNL